MTFQSSRIRRQAERLGGASRRAGQETNVDDFIGITHQRQEQVKKFDRFIQM